MLFQILADITVGIHLLFVVFVIFGGIIVLRWPKLAWVHLPAVFWGAAIEIIGWVCPLTYLENYFRAKSSSAGYDISFVEHYIQPLLYPDILFEGHFPQYGFLLIGLFILAINIIVYWQIIRCRRK